MEKMQVHSRKFLGILGGGQLAAMSIEAAKNLGFAIAVLGEKNCPAEKLCDFFFEGSPKNKSDIENFSNHLHSLTIEVEDVNTEAMENAKKLGVKVFPDPKLVELIQDKGKQKKFFIENKIPTPEYVVTNDRKDLEKLAHFFPAVHKLCKGGYDGRGVTVIHNSTDIAKGFDSPAILEKKVEIQKEISVLVVRSQQGEILAYEPCEMIFQSERNQLDYLISPTDIPAEQKQKAQDLAIHVVQAFARDYEMVGLLAVELFLDEDGNFLVNEVAPRPHNSAHHTIEANECSQFEQYLRAVQGMPLGSKWQKTPVALMANILGTEEEPGLAIWENTIPKNTEEFRNIFVHNYGKLESRAGRKMGHITILGNSREEVMEKLRKVRTRLKVKIQR